MYRRFFNKYAISSSSHIRLYASASHVPRKGSTNISALLKPFHKRKRRKDIADPTHPSRILFLDIKQYLESCLSLYNKKITSDDVENLEKMIKAFLPAQRKEKVLENIKVTGNTHDGDGLALVPKLLYASEVEDSELLMGKFTVFIIPKTVIGDKVNIKIKLHHQYFAEGELLKVVNSGTKESRRNDKLILCKHFHECNGCQFQMLSYEDQLHYKQQLIAKAYKLFYPELARDQGFGSVIGSPLQYAYRTKINPHCTLESNNKKCSTIGFQHVNNQGKVDVEHCPIATIEINDKLQQAREHYIGKEHLTQLTLRQSLRVDHSTGEFYPIALEGQKTVVTERIEDFVYQFENSCFFQNNNSILSMVLDYMRFHINLLDNKVVNIVDTYCGVGFFGIALSQLHDNVKVFGIEVSDSSIKYAQHNAKLNGLDPEKVKFLLGDASKIFSNKEFKDDNNRFKIKGDDSVVIIDPSRKGSDERFLRQLLDFEPRMIIYVSCNVFTQARDLALFEKLQLQLHQNKKLYNVEQVTGFDFFPQTKHVESIAVLKKKIIGYE